MQIYSEISAKYLLRLNEGKLYKNTVPFVLDEWINETSILQIEQALACFVQRKSRKFGYKKRSKIARRKR